MGTGRPMGANWWPGYLAARFTNQVELVWPAAVPGWVLQQNTSDLNPEAWADVPGSPSVSGPEQFHPFTTSGGRVFFRLRKR